jgi:hypothetical protein
MFEQWDQEDEFLRYAAEVVDEIAEQLVVEAGDAYGLQLDVFGELPKCHREAMPDTAVDALVDHNLAVKARKIGEVITLHHDS